MVIESALFHPKATFIGGHHNFDFEACLYDDINLRDSGWGL